MPDKNELRAVVRDNLDAVMERLNGALRGDRLDELEATITRLGRRSVLPHWYAGLKANHVLPNLDGKTIGSVLEMLFVAILETGVLRAKGVGPLRVNPARGVDLPDLDLGIKAPSENYCTSEPFFSAYERLYGNEYDCVVILTDYQTAKKRPPLRISALKWKYLRGSEVADIALCGVARTLREELILSSPEHAKRIFRFLAYVNQRHWLAKQLLFLVKNLYANEDFIDKTINRMVEDFKTQNDRLAAIDGELIPESDLQALLRVRDVRPRSVGIIDQVDNWIAADLKEASRLPNDNEWARLQTCALDGKIGMSFALQWRYNFSQLFPRPRGKRKSKSTAPIAAPASPAAEFDLDPEAELAADDCAQFPSE